jgi:Fe-Mn family superoxide dismutase
LPADRSVVVYCRFGFEVGQGVAAALARRGCKAQFLAGGLSAWRAEGGAVVSMEKEKQP